MTEQMCLIQQQFHELRDLVHAEAGPERLVPRIDDLCLKVLWEIGLLSCWQPERKEPCSRS